MLELILLLCLVMLAAYPLGRYLAAIMQNQPMRIDGCFTWLEKPLYALLATHPQNSMTVKSYIGCFLTSCAVMALLAWGILMTQAWLPLNPDHIPNMSWDLALHTVISFLTNTDQQHYAGQTQLSYLSQMMVIVGLQVISPMMGLAILVATIRALFIPNNHPNETSQFQQRRVGNYWADLIRPTVRFLLPLCLLWSLLLNSQGVPATFNAGAQVTVLDQHAATTQYIPLGPVAPLVAIKQLGSNGGGWYSPNSATPLENPTALSNFMEMFAILLIPVAVIFMLGILSRRRKFSGLVFASMLMMSLLSSIAALWSEAWSHAALHPAIMEGKEVRFGEMSSALWAALTTQVNNGSVNMMHDSATPLTGLVTLVNMLINAIWGGIGCGVQQFFIYLFLGVFIAGLMTGRTPEIFGRKIEAEEIKLLAVVILLQPIVILALTSIALFFPSLTANSNPAFHGISQVFYEYVSAFANNGSGFEGLGDNTPWWNLSCSLALLLGRFPTLIIPLWIAARLASKRKIPESRGSLQIETPTFALTLIAIVLMLTLLQFMPVLVLGPIADQFVLLHG